MCISFMQLEIYWDKNVRHFLGEQSSWVKVTILLYKIYKVIRNQVLYHCFILRVNISYCGEITVYIFGVGQF